MRLEHRQLAGSRSTIAVRVWETLSHSPQFMHLPSDTTGTYALALAGDELGYRFVPCYPGTKVPLVKWKRLQAEPPPPAFYERFFRGTRNNIAVLTSGMVLFDCDSPEKEAVVTRHCGETPWRVRTPRGGVHLGYRRRKGVAVTNRVKVRGLPIDIRTDGGLALLPPSTTEHGAYEWLGAGLIPIADLPVATVGWTRDRVRRRTRSALADTQHFPLGVGLIRHPERYCLRIESVQGQNGSRGLVRVVCVLRDAGRTPDQIFDFVKHVWGPACCRPAWSDREILHCIERHCGTG